MNEIVFHEVAILDQSERRERFGEDALLLADFPTGVAVRCHLVEQIDEGLNQRCHRVVFVCDEIDLLRARRDRMFAAPKDVPDDVDSRERNFADWIGVVRDGQLETIAIMIDEARFKKKGFSDPSGFRLGLSSVAMLDQLPTRVAFSFSKLMSGLSSYRAPTARAPQRSSSVMLIGSWFSALVNSCCRLSIRALSYTAATIDHDQNDLDVGKTVAWQSAVLAFGDAVGLAYLTTSRPPSAVVGSVPELMNGSLFRSTIWTSAHFGHVPASHIPRDQPSRSIRCACRRVRLDPRRQ
ncbi:MAG TPA: hypothetical protein VHW01_07825 [Polyangiaceae bacterium]|nr:hypothetical protein [Polyangiaceae bacterium]